MISTLARECGDIVANNAPGWWLWRGRRVVLVDGATVTLADTEDNQAAYPQPSSQKTGLGFPLARMVALVCLDSGVVRDVAVGPCAGKGSDGLTLLRDILDTLQAGGKILVTTFLDPNQTSKGMLKALFRQRWHVGIDQPYCLHKAVIRTWMGMLAHRHVGGWPSRVETGSVETG